MLSQAKAKPPLNGALVPTHFSHHNGGDLSFKCILMTKKSKIMARGVLPLEDIMYSLQPSVLFLASVRPTACSSVCNIFIQRSSNNFSSEIDYIVVVRKSTYRCISRKKLLQQTVQVYIMKLASNVIDSLKRR